MTTDVITLIGVKINFDQFKQIIRDNFNDKLINYKKKLDKYNEISKCPQCVHCRHQSYDFYDKDPEVSVYHSLNQNGEVMVPNSDYRLIVIFDYNMKYLRAYISIDSVEHTGDGGEGCCDEMKLPTTETIDNFKKNITSKLFKKYNIDHEFRVYLDVSYR